MKYFGRIFVEIVVLSLFLLSCEKGAEIGIIYPPTNGDRKDSEIEKNVKSYLSPSLPKLKRAENCKEVEVYVESIMEKYAEKMIRELKEGKYVKYDGITKDGIAIGWFFASETQQQQQIEYSETTVQEKGIDEADIIKTDGERIYASLVGNLIVLKSYPANNAELLSKVIVDKRYNQSEILLKGDKIFVFSGGYNNRYYPIYYGYNYYPSSFNIFEFEGLSKPKHLRTLYLEGNYITARKKGDKIYVVGNFTPVQFFSTANPIFNWIINEAAKYDYNISKVKINLEFDDIKSIFPMIKEFSFSSYVTSTTSEISVGGEEFPLDCSNVFVSTNPSGLNSTFVVLIEDEGKPKIVYAIGVGSEYSTPFVYMSSRSIYIAYSQNNWFWGGSEEEKTTVNRFDISSEDVVYSSSGVVDGRIPVVYGRTGEKNAELSMNEYNEIFRIATSKGYFGKSDNIISVLKEKEGKLEVVGQVKNIAPGELIHSARFIGDQGFIVTFKKTDPFFTIDLSDPTNPKVAGELKVSGYSSLILPFDSNHLLTVGKETEDVGDFAWYQGLQLSIFDVSVFSAPRLLHRIEIGSRGTESSALFDYRALTFFKDILSLPIHYFENINTSGYGGYKFSGFSLYKVSLEKGFEHLGDVKGCEDKESFIRMYYYSLCEPIRSVIIERTVWASIISEDESLFIATDLESFSPVTKVAIKF